MLKFIKSPGSNDKYFDRVFRNRIFKKGGGNISPYGEPGREGCSFGIKCRSYTDPNNAIMRLSFLLRKENYFLDCNGLRKKGELLVKTEGIGRNKKLYIALDKRLGARAIWKNDKRAMEIEDYIFSQLSSCIERNYGVIYTKLFNRIEYSTFLEIAEKDKDVAFDLLGVSNGSKKNLESLLKKVERDRKD